MYRKPRHRLERTHKVKLAQPGNSGNIFHAQLLVVSTVQKFDGVANVSTHQRMTCSFYGPFSIMTGQNIEYLIHYTFFFQWVMTVIQHSCRMEHTTGNQRSVTHTFGTEINVSSSFQYAFCHVVDQFP